MVTLPALAPFTEKLKFLVAIRPGTAAPAYYARLAAALDRVSNGRLLLNIVVGGNPLEDINNVRRLQLVLKEGVIVSDRRDQWAKLQAPAF